VHLKGVFFLLIFVAYIATPPVVNYFKADGEISMATIEEEKSNADDKTESEKKIEIIHKSFISYNIAGNFEFEDPSKFSSRLAYSIYLDPISPPPRHL
jgi:hypothetical protein